jgi:soluble lytic murein transglycosylase-like protein
MAKWPHQEIEIMQRIVLRSPKIFSVATAGLLGACASGYRQLQIELNPMHPTPPVEVSQDQGWDRLKSSIDLSGLNSDEFADLEQILKAQQFEGQRQFKEAHSNWSAAIKVATGTLGDMALTGWVKSLCRQYATPVSLEIFMEDLLKESGQGRNAPRFMEKDLVAEPKLRSFILQHAPQCATSSSSPVAITPSANSAPERPGIPADDPLLTQLAASICKKDSRKDDAWQFWLATLNIETKGYLDALVSQCQGKVQASVDQFMSVLPKLSANASTAHLALEGYSRVIKMRRDQGERDAVAPLFIPLMRQWQNAVITEQSLGISTSTFDLRRAEDYLSAARHQVLIGDYERGKTYAQNAIEFLASLTGKPWTLEGDSKQKIAGLKAEAMHLLAYRIAVEQGRLSDAIDTAMRALKIENLSDDWRVRLGFSVGMYYFLSDQVDRARLQWESMLNETLDDSSKPMVLFWISRSQSVLGHVSEADFYRKTIAEDYPMSFYSIVGLGQTGVNYAENWKDLLGNPEGLLSKLKTWFDEKPDGLMNTENYPRKIYRIEALIHSGLNQLAKLLTDDLAKDIEKDSRLAGDVKIQNYITKLYAAGGQWVSAITLLTKLSKQSGYWKDYPEQLLVYFPTPWIDDFEREAADAKVSVDTTLAIARQETAFKPDAKSPAKAYGLMQLTYPTAKALIAKFPTLSKELTLSKPEELFKPSSNIKLGVTYIKDLLDQFDDEAAFVYAAYNAGEQAVLGWQERRSFEDPLTMVELIPYGETKQYVKNVWRNELIYSNLRSALKE